MATAEPIAEGGRDFIRDIVQADLDAKRHSTVVTRFPPEPNGYLHIGHAKSICLNFGIAEEFGGRCHLRFDDTNPTKEEQEYIDAIESDVRWLGFDWGKNLFHASDYFERLYEWAEHLIRTGLAYVDDQSQHDMRTSRGTLTEPGKNSPFRDRPVDENLDLFRRMKAGEFPNGARVLRAKIDMASGNINLRDPVLYRILQGAAPAHRHHLVDLSELRLRPRAVRRDRGHHPFDLHLGVRGSPAALRLVPGEPAGAVEAAPVRVRAAEPDLHGAVEARADHAGPRRPCQRLGRSADADAGRSAPPRRAARRDPRFRQAHRRGEGQQRGRRQRARLLDPRGAEQDRAAADGGAPPAQGGDRKLSEGPGEELDAVNHPDNPDAGSRKIKFGRELYIERDDFMENPPKKFFRLSPGMEVRLRYAYFITCREAVKNAAGEVIELRCTYDPATRGGNAPDGRKVKATIHWVSAKDSKPAEVRIYNPLFTKPDPTGGEGFTADLNPQSLEVLSDARVEPELAAASNSAEPVQFERQGYFVRDPDSTPDRPVFNRTVGLRDTFAKEVGGRAGLIGASSVPTSARGDASAWRIGAGVAAGAVAGSGRGTPQSGAAVRWTWADSLPDFGRAAEQFRNWAIADTGPGRLLPWLPVAFGLGIALYFTADREPAWWAGVGPRRILLRHRDSSRGDARSRFPMALAFAAVAAGFAIATLKSVQVAHPILARPAGNVAVAGFVEVREERERTDRIVVRALSLEGNRLEQKPDRVRVSVKKGTAPPVGAYVTFRARLSPPLEPLRPGGYDFARDLYFQGIGATGFVLGAIKPAEAPSPPGLWLRYAASIQGSATASTPASARCCRATAAPSPRR